MSSSENKLVKDFEKVIWLFRDKSLPEEQMNYWRQKLSESQELKKYFNETTYSLNYYSKSSEFDIDTSKFSKMIDIATNKKTFWQSISKFIKSIIDRKKLQPYYGKLVLSLAILIIFITTLLLTHNPFKKLNQNNSPLDWDAKTITAQIEEIEYSIDELNADQQEKELLDIENIVRRMSKIFKDKKL